MPGSLQDDSRAESGDLTLRELPAEIFFLSQYLGTGGRTQAEWYVKVLGQSNWPCGNLSSRDLDLRG